MGVFIVPLTGSITAWDQEEANVNSAKKKKKKTLIRPEGHGRVCGQCFIDKFIGDFDLTITTSTLTQNRRFTHGCASLATGAILHCTRIALTSEIDNGGL